MPIAGKVAIFTPADGRSIKLAVKNEGTVPIGVTNNYFPSRRAMDADTYRHDDTSYGHGMECQPNTWSWLEFPIGGSYNQHTIRAGGVLRVGLRAACWAAVDIPQPGEPPVILDLEHDFEWYGSEGTHVGQVQHMRSWNSNRMHRNTGGEDPVLQELMSAMDFKKDGVRLEGKATVTAHPGPGGILSHWTVRFDNEGDLPFIGTVVFRDAAKNDGMGLESMAVPNRNSAAEQRIEHNGNYGLLARSGQALRLGVRGYGVFELELPNGGSVEVPIRRFRRQTTQKNDAFFDLEEVTKKRREKIDKVRFFEGGRPMNDEIRPIVYRGAEANMRAPFDAPRVLVRAVDHSDDNPGGGWIIEMTSNLRAADDHGDVGFVGTLKLGPAGADPVQLPPKKFERRGDRNIWFLPNAAQLGAYSARPGERLLVGTRGLGWFASIPLPGEGAEVDTEQRFDLWGWRPDQYRRDNLAAEFVAQVARGPDERRNE